MGPTLDIELLVLDLTTCAPCRETNQALEGALTELSPVLAAAGLSARVTTTIVGSAEEAEALRLVTSPTIRVNGRDVAPIISESHCGSCSAISGEATDCRTWTVDDSSHAVSPTPSLLVDAILAVAQESSPATTEDDFELPANLRRFFAGREVVSSCDR
jgi:hypothetical protein